LLLELLLGINQLLLVLRLLIFQPFDFLLGLDNPFFEFLFLVFFFGPLLLEFLFLAITMLFLGLFSLRVGLHLLDLGLDDVFHLSERLLCFLLRSGFRMRLGLKEAVEFRV